MIVVDATVLIALSRIGRLRLLQEAYGEVLISPEVRVEVVDQGKAIAAPGVEHVELALKQGWVRVARLTAGERQTVRRLERTTTLDKGETESLALASSRGLRLVADDKEARTTARAMDVEYLGTLGVLLEALVRGHVAADDFEMAVRDLAGVLWLSPDVVAEVLRRGREVRR